jgi:uncharacterized protein
MTRRSRLILVSVGALVSLALYGFWFEPDGISVREHDVLLGPDQNAFQQPLRIAVIADLHAGAPYIDETKIDRIVALTNAAKPDLILLTGDFVIQGVIGGRRIPIETIARKLRGLSAPLGVFSVLGNHDRWDDAARIGAALEDAGFPVLENKAAEIMRQGQVLYVVGLSDAYTTKPDIGGALSDVPHGKTSICFTHSPDVFPELPATCALTIAAHTHGGQVWLPLIGRPVVPSRFRQRYAAGLVHENGKTLFISTGIGTSLIPVRFGVPPEVTVLNVK